jgi:L-fuconate dehydratase
MFDYISVTGTMDDRIIEYVDHLHEHFLDPVRIQNGCYLPPDMPGYSITMKQESVVKYEFPVGKFWRSVKEQAHAL